MYALSPPSNSRASSCTVWATSQHPVQDCRQERCWNPSLQPRNIKVWYTPQKSNNWGGVSFRPRKTLGFTLNKLDIVGFSLVFQQWKLGDLEFTNHRMEFVKQTNNKMVSQPIKTYIWCIYIYNYHYMVLTINKGEATSGGWWILVCGWSF